MIKNSFFWPIALIVMGIVMLATNLGFMPKSLWNFWSVVTIIIGLSGLVLTDKKDWMIFSKPKKKKKKSKKKKSKKS